MESVVLECRPAMDSLLIRRFVLVLATAIAFSAVAAAQSGRRSTTKPPPPPPPVSDQKEVEAKPEKAARIQLLVGIEDPSVFNNLPLQLTDTVLQACLQRLDEPGDVVAMGAPQRMSRADAVKAAKQETQRFVVWLQFGSDVADSGRQVSNEADELYVSYFVFEPATAKVMKSGRTSYSMYKKGSVGVSNPIPRRGVYSEQAARELGRAAAEKILAAFAIKINPWPR